MKKVFYTVCFSLLAGNFLAASPAKAINYVFRGSDTYNCGPTASQICTITYNDFEIAWNAGTSSWSSAGSPNGTIVFLNTSDNQNYIFTSSAAVVGDASTIQLTRFSEIVSFELAAAPTDIPGDKITFTRLGNTGFTSSSLNTTFAGLSTLSGTGNVQAVPFIPSVLALLPLAAYSRRKNLRSLSLTKV